MDVLKRKPQHLSPRPKARRYPGEDACSVALRGCALGPVGRRYLKTMSKRENNEKSPKRENLSVALKDSRVFALFLWFSRSILVSRPILRPQFVRNINTTMAATSAINI